MKQKNSIHYIIYACVCTMTLLLSACGDFNERLDGYNKDDYRPKDVKTIVDSITTVYANTDTARYYLIPAWLKTTYPTADNGSTAKVAYRHHHKTPTLKDTILNAKDPFILVNGKWNFDPSMTVTIPHTKNDPIVKKFYQTACDWVWTNVDQASGVTQKGKGYVEKYGNTEHYTGTDCYRAYVDWTTASARQYMPTAYAGMTDDEIVNTLQKNFINVYTHVLAKIYPDAAAIDGIDVIYTLKFTAKVGTDDYKVYQIKYRVIANGTFEYVGASLKVNQ